MVAHRQQNKQRRVVLKRYHDGSEYILDGRADIEPNVSYTPETYDLSELTRGELEKFKKNKKLKRLRKKMRRIYG